MAPRWAPPQRRPVRCAAGAAPAVLSVLSVLVLLGCCAPSVAAGGCSVPDGYVCQMVSKPGTKLQDLIGVECNVTNDTCSCDTSMWRDVHPQWKVVTSRMHRDMASNTTAGYWYLTDQEGKCGATFKHGLTEPELLACPPGFYCEGGLNNPESCSNGDHCPGTTPKDPRRCPAGFFCPFPAAPKIACMDGALCEEGSTEPAGCDAGTYCLAGKSHQCPSGYYCPLASTHPLKCHPFKLCPAGSTHEDSAPIALTLAGLGIVFMIVGAMYYDAYSHNPIIVCSVLGVGILSIWFADGIVGGFLFLNFVAIAANFLLYRFFQCPPLAAQGLLNATFAAAIIVLYRLNPAWAMLMGGLWLCFSVAYLMTRSSFKLRLVGRALLVLLLVALVFAYWRLDPSFLGYYVGGVVGLASYYIVSWLCTERFGVCERALPFASRWRQEGDRIAEPHDNDLPEQSPDSLADSPPATGDFGVVEEALGLSRDAPLLCNASTAGSYTFGGAAGSDACLPSGIGSAASEAGCEAGSVVERKGVSFLLKGVNFELRDGTALLKDINMGIEPGRRCAVMGPSGSGKSTLLAVLSGRGSYGVVKGSMRVGGHAAKDPRFLRHVTGYVPQDDILHGELTVTENVLFQARLRLPSSLSDEEVQGAVRTVLKDLHLSAIHDSRVGTPEQRGISGGQRKRVSIAMELVSRPLLLFADEPTSGLDSTTAHEVIGCMNESAHKLSTTVLCVIHQPRYQTLLLFDDLILLATGGTLVYAGPTKCAKEAFRVHMDIQFEENANPADSILDAIQGPCHIPAGTLKTLMREYGSVSCCEALPPVRSSQFSRETVPFFKAVLIFMDRAMLQNMRAYPAIIINQILCVAVMFILATIMPNINIEKFFMQSNFATLFLMLLQGVAAQRIFGSDLLMTLREAGVGVSSVAYIVAKDLGSFFEITLSAAIFAASWGTLSGVQQPVTGIFAGAWAFIYSVYGVGYIFSICMSPGAAQMSMVVAAFVSFCVSGVYEPLLPAMAAMLAGRGWMVPAMSSVRWFWGYLLTMEMRNLTALAKQYGRGTLQWRGYDLDYLDGCSLEGVPFKNGVISLRDAWLANRGWVCSSVDMLLLGIMFRFVAGACLIFYINAHTSKMAQFFGQSEKGVKKLLGKLFTVLVSSFMVILFFCEVWIFSIKGIDMRALLDYLHSKPDHPFSLLGGLASGASAALR